MIWNSIKIIESETIFLSPSYYPIKKQLRYKRHLIIKSEIFIRLNNRIIFLSVEKGFICIDNRQDNNEGA